MNRYGYIRFAQVPERVLTRGLVVLLNRKLEVELLRRTGHIYGRGSDREAALGCGFSLLVCSSRGLLSPL